MNLANSRPVLVRIATNTDTMKRLLLILTLALLPVLSTALPCRAADFTCLAAPYPPYSVSKGLSVSGMSVSTLTTIMGMCGLPLAESAIKLAPWAYAYETTAREQQCILLNATRNRETEHLFKWVGPITTSKIVLIGKRDRKLFIPTKAELKNHRIATVRWSRPEKALLSGGMSVNDLKRSASHVQALRRLQRDEVDLFAATQAAAPDLMAGLGLNHEDYVVCYTYEEEPLYFAFSRDTDDRLITRLNRALKEIKSTGEGGLSLFDRMFTDKMMN